MSVLAAAPARVPARVAHRRTRPFRYEFAHGTTMWLVDVADPEVAFPRWLRPFLSIRSRDHLAPDDDRPWTVKLRSFLDAQGIGWSARRVLALTNARALGYVFDPLTTYFCFDADGHLEGVLAEVHNTYGERHCYPLAVTETGRAEVDKEFYVSPFFTVDGRYDIRTRLTEDDVAVAIALTQGDETVFTGSVHGPLRPVTLPATLAAVARNPLPSHRVSGLIRWHGIRLWLRRLPVVPRQQHRAPKGIA
ncbi:MAG TPA: DUF1365 domain-containing protein [Nocardioides sp.]|uniref:DUF1365 domain-containing protein n=1 Tax=Nocardioides sp. TaxID=35761 RepID=UPI002D800E5E|nr:DUF1365 domain-containing protein [Nocardioides sp.]HET6654335.1 DUF1365 domain-containing protein [Nocardioides sp.]